MSFHLVEPGRVAHSKGAAVVKTLRTLNRTRYLGVFLARSRLTWLVDGLYWAVARSRGVLGRFVADAPGPTRFRG